MFAQVRDRFPLQNRTAYQHYSCENKSKHLLNILYHVLSHDVIWQSGRLYKEKSIKDSYILMINYDHHAQLTTLKVHHHNLCRQIQSGEDLQTDPNEVAQAVLSQQS